MIDNAFENSDSLSEASRSQKRVSRLHAIRISKEPSKHSKTQELIPNLLRNMSVIIEENQTIET